MKLIPLIFFFCLSLNLSAEEEPIKGRGQFLKSHTLVSVQTKIVTYGKVNFYEITYQAKFKINLNKHLFSCLVETILPYKEEPQKILPVQLETDVRDAEFNRNKNEFTLLFRREQDEVSISCKQDKPENFDYKLRDVDHALIAKDVKIYKMFEADKSKIKLNPNPDKKGRRSRQSKFAA
ncbi:MAG: hypothetical protein H7328_06825 [Bdellovibrio sp.]|nr:hypothetical protein [Bdellovibrio sp.]